MIAVLDLEAALIVLAQGGVLGVPTDTVYGVAASIESPIGVATLFELKHRPRSLALPVLVESIEQISALGVDWPHDARRLASSFWPGALTIVVNAPDDLARRVGSDTSSIGFRIPDLLVLRQLLARSGPLVVTSANQHGERPSHSVAEVIDAFRGSSALAGVLDGGERDGAVSTVVDLTGGTVRLVREGAIDMQLITAALA